MAPTKTRHSEEEYFAKIEIETKSKLVKDINSRYKKEERAKLKELHHMFCPKCGMNLHELVFKGVIIDKCYDCGAVVLTHDEFENFVGAEESVMKSLVSLFK